ncbi:MAG TPA: hypothetical protein VM093_08450 [Aeromicrobium sp.]|nr:hypothetical protein [Aeromicrobium sp.]
MSIFTKAATCVASTLLFGTLTACSGGDGPDSAYCKDLEAAAPKFAGLRTSDPGQLEGVIKATHKLTEEAPGDIEDDWKVLDAGMTGIENALKEAGIKFSDFDELQQGKMPEGVKVEKLQSLPAKFQQLDSPAADKAYKNIREHAKDVCKVTFES